MTVHSLNTGEQLTAQQKKRMRTMLLLLLLLVYSALVVSQTNLNDINYVATSSFVPTIKDAVKYSDMPEIKDTVKKISGIRYGIKSEPLFPKYQVQSIDAAKMQNEPLPKLYHSMLKAGYGPLYNMPYAEFWAGSRRNREKSVGAHLRHLSSSTHLEDHGYGGYSENRAEIFGKQFYKKHTLSGEFNYDRNVIHYYGFDTTLNDIKDRDFTRQRYQLFEPAVKLQSHYSDSTHMNHTIGLSYYNYSNLNFESENNIHLNALGSMFLNREKLNIGLTADHYNHKQANDTLNDLIVSLLPSFEARGKKWDAELGINATLDQFKGSTRFYVYPKMSVQYDVFESVIIPYAAITGGLIKNSMRRLTAENPFADTTLNYVNTNNKYNFILGLKGNISSNTSYDARVSYGQYDSLHFYSIDYSGPVQLYNRFNVLYDNATLLNVTGSLNYRLKEKINLLAKGNYYLYSTQNLTRAYHRPDFDMTFTCLYNLKSKIIVKGDLFVMGNQWAFTQDNSSGSIAMATKEIKGWADASLEVEYRYSNMLGFFARANNIANQRYYRWERYPSQRFNFLIGLTFIPF